jgi:hypothetical protein
MSEILVRPLLTLLILATMATPAIAQTPSTESSAAAVRLVEASGWREGMAPIRAEMQASTKTNLRARLREELGSPTAEEYAEMDAMIDQVLSKYTLDDTITDVVSVYQTRYSTAELEELASFFSSPLYKKFWADIPEIKLEVLESAKRKIQPAIQDTVRRVSARIDEMKKARPSK